MSDEVHPVRKGAEETDIQVVAAGLGLEGPGWGDFAMPAIGCAGSMVGVYLGHCAWVSRIKLE